MSFLFADKAPFDGWIAAAISGRKELTSIASLVLVVWVLAILLMALNHSSFRLLEGYTWPLKSKRLLNRQLETRLKQREETDALFTVLEQARAALKAIKDRPLASDEETLSAERAVQQARRAYNSATSKTVLEYPEERELVLPTRFGNAVRSFERYPSRVYGAESILVWPRLQAVITKEFQDAIADARAPVNMFVNLVVVFSFASTTSLVRAGFWMWRHGLGWQMFAFLGGALAYALLVALCYWRAIATAKLWGQVVKSAFDVYLPGLAKLLGFRHPGNPAERKAFWSELSYQFQFHESADSTAWDPDPPLPVPTSPTRQTKTVRVRREV